MDKKTPFNISLKAKGALTFVILLFILTGIYFFDLFIGYPEIKNRGNSSDILFEVKEGTGPSAIADALYKAGALSTPDKFSLWLRLTSRVPGLQAGECVIRGNMTPFELYGILSSGKSAKGIRVTIPEGYTLSKMSVLFNQNRLVAKQEFYEAATDTVFLRELGLNTGTCEGFLFPDTYYFNKNVTARQIIVRMFNNFKSRYKNIAGSDKKDLLNTVILASIVQAETKIPEEAPIIAGVYTNRLNPKIFPANILQADPAVAYGCNPYVNPRSLSCLTFTGRLGHKQLRDRQNRYNTYIRKGLPPGPICSPGLPALKAAILPAKVPYIFFVASKNGHHTFSTTLKEHNRAVQAYLKQKK